MCTWKSHRQAEPQRDIFMILVAVPFLPPIFCCFKYFNRGVLFLHPGFSFDLAGYHNCILRKLPPVPKKKKLDHAVQNAGRHLIKLQALLLHYWYNSMYNIENFLWLPETPLPSIREWCLPQTEPVRDEEYEKDMLSSLSSLSILVLQGLHCWMSGH